MAQDYAYHVSVYHPRVLRHPKHDHETFKREMNYYNSPNFGWGEDPYKYMEDEKKSKQKRRWFC